MVDELTLARGDRRFAKLMAAWARIEVLIIDDFLLRPLNVEQTDQLQNYAKGGESKESDNRSSVTS